MGCDIHAIVQRRIGDRWETVTPPPEMLDPYGDLPFEFRNYELFAVLAGVRNYDNVTPIAEPRGLPDDAGVEQGTFGWPSGATSSRVELDGKWLGEHSFSWLTAAELSAYDWSGVQYVDPDDWLPWLLSLAEDPGDVRLVFGFDS
jgi:hypothetical protein